MSGRVTALKSSDAMTCTTESSLSTGVRCGFFGRENFDEWPAITYDQFRRWAAEADRDRQQVEDALDRLRRIFGR